MSETPLLKSTLMDAQQHSRHIIVNEALYMLEGIKRVISRSIGAVPASPAEGDSYIVNTLTDAWTDATLGDLALYYAAAWHFITPFTGLSTIVSDEKATAIWTGTLWHVTDFGIALSADPADPPNDMRCTWQSDGTGAGDDGDIMMKITDSGGTTKTTTLIDFSTL